MTVCVYRAKGGKLFRYDFCERGTRYNARGFWTRKAATAAESDRRKAVQSGLTDPYPTMKQLVGSFLAASQRTKSPEWCQQLGWKLNKGFGHLAHLHPREVTPGHLENALDQIRAAGNGPRSVNEFRKVIKSVFAFALAREALHRNPAAAIEKMPEPDSQVDPIPTQHLLRLIAAADVRLRAVLLFLAQTGARWIEARRLQKTDVHVNVQKPFALLRTKKRRGGHEKARPQPLTKKALDAIGLTSHMSDTFVFPDGHGDAMRYRAELKRLHALCEHLKLPHYSFHQVRHWAGSVATAMGRNKKAVAAFLGHADTNATEGYMHAVDADLWEVAHRLEAELEAATDAPIDTAAGEESGCG